MITIINVISLDYPWRRWPLFGTVFFIFYLILIVGCKENNYSYDEPDLSMGFEYKDFGLNIRLDSMSDTAIVQINQEDLFTAKRSGTVHKIVDTYDTTFNIPVFKPQTLGVSINGEFCRILALPDSNATIEVLFPSSQRSRIEIVLHSPIDRYLSEKTQPGWQSSDGLWELQIERLEKDYNSKSALLEDHKTTLPKWFISYESKNQLLDYWEDMYLTHTYRGGMLGLHDIMPGELVNFLNTLSLDQNGPYLRSNYLTLTSAKIASPQIQKETWHTTFSIQDRFKYIIENLSEQTKPAKQKIALQLYITMTTGSRDFSHDLQNKALGLLDADHRQLLNAILQSQETIIGTNAGNFQLQTPGGGFKKREDYAGKPLYISFWFTGCKPCIKAFPAENELVEKFAESNLQFIRICTNSEKQLWLEMIEKYELKTENLFANRNWSKILTNQYKLNSYPKYLLVNKDGIIVEEKGLSPDNEDIVDKLTEVL